MYYVKGGAGQDSKDCGKTVETCKKTPHLYVLLAKTVVILKHLNSARLT